MATGLVVWSKTAATNASVDSAINFAEGQAPSSVNDSARGLMASAAKWRDDLNGTIATSGTSTAYTATSNQSFAALTAGLEITCQFDEDCGTPVTLAVDGLTAKPLRPAAGVELVASAIKAGSIHRATYVTSNSGEWLLHDVNPIIIAADQVVTASIVDKAVTLAKMADRAKNTLIGRYTASTGVPQEVTVSDGLVLNPSNGNLSVAAQPIAAGYKNLKITNNASNPNTQIDITADAVTVETASGVAYRLRGVSQTNNLGTTGAGALDGGSIASGTFYAVFIIYDPATDTVSSLTSTNATAPTLPSGYTAFARIGWVRTSNGSAQLRGGLQLGRRFQYVLGLAQTTSPPVITSGSAGTFDNISPSLASVSLSGFVPSTASEISLIPAIQYTGAAVSNILVAPNTSWGGTNKGPTGSSGINWPVWVFSAAQSMQAITMLLESTSSIAWTSSGAGGAISCLGWTDNI